MAAALALVVAGVAAPSEGRAATIGFEQLAAVAPGGMTTLRVSIDAGVGQLFDVASFDLVADPSLSLLSASSPDPTDSLFFDPVFGVSLIKIAPAQVGVFDLAVQAPGAVGSFGISFLAPFGFANVLTTLGPEILEGRATIAVTDGNPQIIPLPATALLLFSGVAALAGVAAVGRRRRA